MPKPIKPPKPTAPERPSENTPTRPIHAPSLTWQCAICGGITDAVSCPIDGKSR